MRERRTDRPAPAPAPVPGVVGGAGAFTDARRRTLLRGSTPEDREALPARVAAGVHSPSFAGVAFSFMSMLAGGAGGATGVDAASRSR
jgi:hypothetical protein